MDPHVEQVWTGRLVVPVVAGLCLLVVASACTTAGQAQDQPTALATTTTATADPTVPPSPEDAATAAASPASPASPASSPATEPSGNAAVLDFTARRLSGGTIEGVELAGGPVVLWMWAPWCPQCNREAAHVAEAVRDHGGQITFVGMAGHDTDQAHRDFVDEHDLGDMLHVVDEDGSLWSRYGVSYQPAWVFIDDDGATEVVAGGLYDDLESRLQALLAR